MCTPTPQNRTLAPGKCVLLSEYKSIRIVHLKQKQRKFSPTPIACILCPFAYVCVHFSVRVCVCAFRVTLFPSIEVRSIPQWHFIP